MELGIIVARLVWEFDMRLGPASEQVWSKRIEKEIRLGKRQRSEYQLQDWFMSVNQGPIVDFKARGR